MLLVKLDNYIDNIHKFTYDTMPRTIMLIGKPGSGKHLLCNEISKHLNLSTIDITDNISLDTLYDIQLSSIPYIYIIDGDKITEREEAILLKSIEEPTKNCYFIILSSNGNLINTISNRCFKIELPNYSKEDLKLLTNNELVLSIASTPGDIVNLENNSIDSLLNLSHKVIDKINVASYSNTLSIVDKVDPSNNLFLRVLLYSIVDKIKDSKEIIYSKMYDSVSSTLNNYSIKNIDKKLLLENCLTSLWCISRGIDPWI